MILKTHKEKIYIGIIFILLIILITKKNNYYLETVTEVDPKSIITIESTDLFDKSIPWVLEEGKDGLNKVTYRMKEGSTIKEKYKIEESIQKKEQKEKQGTLNFNLYQTQIRNNVALYLQEIQNKNYKNALGYYYRLTTHNSPIITKYNYENLIKINGNPIIGNTTPLYDHSSSKAITVTEVKGNYEDKIIGKEFDTLNIYSIWDGKEFKIFNPEYLSLSIKKEFLEKLVQGTNTNKSHYLGLEISNFYIKFPNKIYFSLNAKTTESILFNKIKVEILNNKTGKKYYQGTVIYNDISKKASWVRTVYKGKSGYKTTFYVPIEFKKEVFSTIYDLMYENGQFIKNNIQILVKPINDTDVYMNYPIYSFSLN